MKLVRIRICSLTIIGVLLLSMIMAPIGMSRNSIDETNGIPVGWSDDINISNYSLRDTEPAIAINNDNIHLAWRRNTASTREIIYTKSTDAGVTWSQNMTLGSSADLAKLPDIVLSENNIHVVWEDQLGWNGIYYRNSTDNGDTWNTIKRISSDGVNAYAPQNFVNSSNVHIAWYDERDGTDGEVYYRRSLDGGIAFDDGLGADQDRRITFSPSVVTAPKISGNGSNISVAWMDERNGDFEIYFMISKDNGATWEDGLGNIGLERRLTFSGVHDYYFEMEDSNIHVAWVKEVWPGPIYKIYYINSTDYGATWSSEKLIVDTNNCYLSDLTVNGNDVHIVWHDWNIDGTTEVYYMNSTNGGISWEPQTRLTYNEGNNSSEPKITVVDDYKHIIWTEWRDGNREIYYKRFPDFPDTSPPTHTNETPLPDSYKDAPGTNVSVHVTDSSGVNESTIQLWINGSLVVHTITPITDGYNVSWISPGFDPGVVECRIVADDNCSNTLDYTWNFTVLALYDIQLQEGWNLISVPLEQVNTSIPSVLTSISGQWDVVKYYDNTDKDDPWKTYRVGASTNDLANIDNTMGFWINVTESDVTLTVRGNITSSTSISLYAGWNLVGYPTQNTETVANAFFGTGATRVEVFNSSEPYLIKEVGPTYVMQPGEGYWVHVPADTVWVIDW